MVETQQYRVRLMLRNTKSIWLCFWLTKKTLRCEQIDTLSKWWNAPEKIKKNNELIYVRCVSAFINRLFKNWRDNKITITENTFLHTSKVLQWGCHRFLKLSFSKNQNLLFCQPTAKNRFILRSHFQNFVKKKFCICS